MPVHFSERSLKVRRLLREQDQAGALPAALTSLRQGYDLAGHFTRREIPVPARTSSRLRVGTAVHCSSRERAAQPRALAGALAALPRAALPLAALPRAARPRAALPPAGRPLADSTPANDFHPAGALPGLDKVFTLQYKVNRRCRGNSLFSGSIENPLGRI